MRHGKKPTRAQKIRIGQAGLAPENWLVVKQKKNGEMVILKFSCRECWQAWLETGKPPKEKGPSDKQTTPDEEGLHPNLVEMYAKAKRKAQRMLHDQATDGSAVTPPPPLGTDAQQ